MVKMMMANRNVKLCDKSHKIHLSLAASISINMEAIHANAVKNSSSKMNVRGNTDTCSAVLSTNSNKLQHSSAEKPKSMSLQ